MVIVMAINCNLTGETTHNYGNLVDTKKLHDFIPEKSKYY